MAAPFKPLKTPLGSLETPEIYHKTMLLMDAINLAPIMLRDPSSFFGSGRETLMHVILR